MNKSRQTLPHLREDRLVSFKTNNFMTTLINPSIFHLSATAESSRTMSCCLFTTSFAPTEPTSSFFRLCHTTYHFKNKIRRLRKVLLVNSNTFAISTLAAIFISLVNINLKSPIMCNLNYCF